MTVLTHQDSAHVPSDAYDCFVSWANKLACTKPWSDNGDGTVEAHSPWWIDSNHEYVPGEGLFSFIGYVSVNGKKRSPHTTPLDLRDATLTIRLRLDSLELQGAHLMLWFQAKDPATGIQSNFLLRDQFMESVGHGKFGEWRVRLATDSARWLCMGSRPDRTDFYGCMPVADALAHVSENFGIVAYGVKLPSSFPNDGTTGLPSGIIRLDEVRIMNR